MRFGSKTEEPAVERMEDHQFLVTLLQLLPYLRLLPKHSILPLSILPLLIFLITTPLILTIPTPSNNILSQSSIRLYRTQSCLLQSITVFLLLLLILPVHLNLTSRISIDLIPPMLLPLTEFPSHSPLINHVCFILILLSPLIPLMN